MKIYILGNFILIPNEYVSERIKERLDHLGEYAGKVETCLAWKFPQDERQNEAEHYLAGYDGGLDVFTIYRK